MAMPLRLCRVATSKSKVVICTQHNGVQYAAAVSAELPIFSAHEMVSHTWYQNEQKDLVVHLTHNSATVIVPLKPLVSDLVVEVRTEALEEKSRECEKQIAELKTALEDGKHCEKGWDWSGMSWFIFVAFAFWPFGPIFGTVKN